jgi:hypothetical protein
MTEATVVKAECGWNCESDCEMDDHDDCWRRAVDARGAEWGSTENIVMQVDDATIDKAKDGEYAAQITEFQNLNSKNILLSLRSTCRPSLPLFFAWKSQVWWIAIHLPPRHKES